VDVTQRHDGDVLVVVLDGRLDSRTAPRVQAELGELMPRQGRILLDLARTSYLSSAGLRILLLLHRQAERNGVQVALAGIGSEVHEVMSATGFLDFFTVVDTVDAGVAVLSA
jgi:anti-sigma B factor antagonist